MLGFMSHATRGGDPDTPWGDMSLTGVELGVGVPWLPPCGMYPPPGLGWLPLDDPFPETSITHFVNNTDKKYN